MLSLCYYTVYLPLLSTYLSGTRNEGTRGNSTIISPTFKSVYDLLTRKGRCTSWVGIQGRLALIFCSILHGGLCVGGHFGLFHFSFFFLFISISRAFFLSFSLFSSLFRGG